MSVLHTKQQPHIPLERQSVNNLIFRLVSASLMTLAFRFAAAVHAADSLPNIVYILTDDLGYGDVHCLGGERCKIPTPNIDRLASQGMIFTEAHSSSSVCTPTRYGVLTGRYNWRSRLQRGILRSSGGSCLITPDRLTVPSLLKQHGYATAAIGKWHLGWTWPDNATDENVDLTKPFTDGPTARGFDYYFGPFMPKKGGDRCFIENDKAAGVPSVQTPSALGKEEPANRRRAGKQELAVAGWSPAAILPTITVKACAFITEQAKTDSPFFLYFPMTSPHTPIAPSDEWRGKSGLKSPYADFVMETDAMVGQVMEALEKSGIAHNTLLIFTSDNGCSKAAGLDNLEKQGHFPSELRRGYKADVWDGGHRVPFIARWPGKIKPGSRCDEIVCLTDLMATCAEIIGAKLPDTAGEDSVSILPALVGTAKMPVREAVVHHSIDGNFAIRQGQWKLILCPNSGGWSKDAPVQTPGQLYDMSEDAGERNNLYAQHPEIVTRLTKLLEQYVADGRSTVGPAQQNDVPVDIWKSSGGKAKRKTE
jgi:arylsulfatase A